MTMKIIDVNANGITVEFDRVALWELEALLRKHVHMTDDGAEELLIESLANTFQMASKACDGVEHFEMLAQKKVPADS
jgi:hypothetical protein